MIVPIRISIFGLLVTIILRSQKQFRTQILRGPDEFKTYSAVYCCISLPFFFQSRGSRAVFQFYPENSQQIEMITAQSMRAGFSGGLVVDYPNSTKAKKYRRKKK